MSKQVQQLNILLADTYALYLKTHNYHWNVEGEGFFYVHAALESQYEELAEAVDSIAERIRALGKKVEASFTAFNQLKTIKDGDANLSLQDMLKDLHADHKKIVSDLKKALSAAEGDEATTTLLGDRVVWHEKIVWMLQSSLKA